MTIYEYRYCNGEVEIVPIDASATANQCRAEKNQYFSPNYSTILKRKDMNVLKIKWNAWVMHSESQDDKHKFLELVVEKKRGIAIENRQRLDRSMVELTIAKEALEKERA